MNTLNIAQSAGAWAGTLDLADKNLIIHADALTRADVLNHRFSLWPAFDPRRLGWELKSEKRNLKGF